MSSREVLVKACTALKDGGKIDDFALFYDKVPDPDTLPNSVKRIIYIDITDYETERIGRAEYNTIQTTAVSIFYRLSGNPRDTVNDSDLLQVYSDLLAELENEEVLLRNTGGQISPYKSGRYNRLLCIFEQVNNTGTF